MILIMLLLVILLFLSLTFFIICLSSIEIEIKDFDFNSSNIKGKKIENFLIYIKLKLLKRFALLKLTIDDSKVSRIKESKIIKIDILKRLLLKNEKEIFTIENAKHIEHFEIDKLNFKIKIATIDTLITSLLVGVVSTLLSILLAKQIKNYENGKYTYIISPIYKEKMQIIINLNCIINIRMVHIINILYMLFKKRRVDYDERTSDRRAYVCRHE